MRDGKDGIPAWLVLMGLLTMTAPLAIDMYLPAFADMAVALSADGGAVERTLAIYLIGMALGQLAYGPISDRFGRKPPLYFGLAVFTLASAGCALAPSIDQLIFWRAVQALGGSACMVVPRAVIRDHYNTQGAARAMSLLLLITGAAPLLAPTLGAQVLIFASWRAIFWFLAAVGAALLVGLHWGMQETLDRTQAPSLSLRSLAQTYGQLLTHRQFITMATAGGLGTGGLFAYLTGSPRVLLEVYGVSPPSYALLFALNALALIVGAQINARLLRKHQPGFILRHALIAWVLISGATILATAFDRLALWGLMASLMGYMACQGFIGSNASALALMRQGRRLGAASALLGTLQFMLGAIAGLLVSLWRTDNALNLVVVMGLCSALALVLGRRGLQLSAASAEKGEAAGAALK